MFKHVTTIRTNRHYRDSTNVWYDTTYTNPVPDENENNGSSSGKRHGDEDAHRCAQERRLVPVVNLLVITVSHQGEIINGNGTLYSQWNPQRSGTH